MKNKDAENLSWELFKRTGEVSYYMLYKALKDDKDDKWKN